MLDKGEISRKLVFGGNLYSLGPFAGNINLTYTPLDHGILFCESCKKCNRYRESRTTSRSPCKSVQIHPWTKRGKRRKVEGRDDPPFGLLSPTPLNTLLCRSCTENKRLLFYWRNDPKTAAKCIHKLQDIDPKSSRAHTYICTDRKR